MRTIILLALFFVLGGCGISGIHCEIETDEELLRRVIGESNEKT